MTVPAWKINRATPYLAHAQETADACNIVGLGFAAASALLAMESTKNGLAGQNIYGGSDGAAAALSGYPHDVDESNYRVFRWLTGKGQQSNGVGPCQITYKPYFDIMEGRGLDPWWPTDNMIFGFELLQGNHRATKSWRDAYARYNGGPKPPPVSFQRGDKFVELLELYRRRYRR